MITVFVGVFNRIETLERTIASYERLTTPHEIVIVDNGTDDHECKALLRRLKAEKRVKKVYTLPGCISMEEATDNFNLAIRDQYEHGGAAEDWYAVSEADVCFDGTDPAALDAYIEVAETTGVESVGPHLRVDERIPASYPLRSRVLACETWMLYARDHEWLGKIPYVKCQIDTTFHLFSRRRFFDRLRMNPVRVGPPYDAMHLDWYLNIFEPNLENGIYIPGGRPMGSWGKQWLRDFWVWFQESPEHACERLIEEPLSEVDLCNNSFMISWCYQYGHGCEPNEQEARDWLRAAIPRQFTRYWDNEGDWIRMVFENDFAALGWDA